MKNRLFWIGVFAYFVADIITTSIGLSMGYQELNPFIKTIPFMIFAKFGVLLLLFGVFKYFEYLRIKNDNSTIIKTEVIMRRIIIFILLVSGVGIGIINNSLVIVASAETGQVAVDSHQIFSYNAGMFGGVGGVSGLPTFATFKFDVTDYNTIVNMTIQFQDGDLNYPNQSNVTSFSCLAPNSCSGIASYSKVLNKFSWVFGSANIIQTPFVLSYDSNIFSDFTATGALNRVTGSPVVNAPYCVVTTDGNCFSSVSPHGGVVYGIDVSTSVTVSYNITYPLAGWYNFFVDKSGNTVASKVYFHSQSNNTLSRCFEDTFTLTNFSGNCEYTDGLYINLSIAAPNFNDVLINASGSTAVVPTPIITPTVNPSTGAGIAWGKTNYSVMEIGTLSWIISPSIFDFLSDFNIKITDQNGATVKEFHNLGLTGTTNYQFQAVGVYTASFYKSICVLGICTNDLKGSSTATVALYPSYIFITSPVVSGLAFNASYIFGNVVLNQGELNSVIIEQFNDGGLDPYSTITLGNYNISAGQTYNVSLIVGSPGKYKATLFDVSRGRVADTNFDAIVGFIPPTLNITQTTVTTDKTEYFFSESIIAAYKIDNVNYSNGSLSKYFAIKNNDRNEYVMINPFNIGRVLTNQVDTFEIPIYNGATEIPCQTIYLCFKLSSNALFYPGNTSIEIHAKSNNSDTILAFGNFTIKSIDADGYGLSVNKPTTCINDPVIITVSSPTTVTVKIIEHSNVADNIVYSQWNSSGNNKTTTKRFFHPGTYEISLIHDGKTKFNRYVTADNKYCTGTQTPTPTSTIPSGQQKANDIANLLDSNLFWALIFTAGLMIAVAIASRKKGEE